MTDVLEGPRLKALRAEQGIKELQAELVVFSELHPYAFVTYEDPQTGEQISQLRIHHEPPASLGIIVGEIVHNLRSGLDHLACALPLVPGARRPPRPQFPVFDFRDFDPAHPKRKVFIREHKGRIGDITPAAYAVVESVQPYNPTNDPGWHPLALLEALWNWDKHNAIHVVSANFGAANIPEGAPENTFAPTGPVQDCQILTRWPKGGLVITHDSPEPLPDISFAIQPAFGGSGPAAGHALLPTLGRIHDYVNREVMGPLERVISEAR